jgi:hypothetical protein
VVHAGQHACRTIFFMAVAAAISGRLTADTSVLTLLTALPYFSVPAKLPLRLAGTLTAKGPAKWDGLDRRGSRPALPHTVPPVGGA